MWLVLLFVRAIIVASEDPTVSKQSTSGKWRDVSLTILQKLEIVG
jgi:hypothetical protein